jgi:iron only hydrogenase large subunit-like protein
LYKFSLNFIYVFSFLFSSGVHYVFDTNFARNFSLIESGKEFVKRFYDSETNTKAFPMLASACPGKHSRARAHTHTLTHTTDQTLVVTY